MERVVGVSSGSTWPVNERRKHASLE